MTPTTASFSSVIPKKIRVIGVPLDLGQSRRGVDMGPSAVRVAGLEARLEALGHVVEDGGNVSVAIAEQKKEGHPRARGQALAAACRELQSETNECRRVRSRNVGISPVFNRTFWSPFDPYSPKFALLLG